MINKFLMWVTKRMPARAIDLDDQHYIERYHVCRIGKLTVLLHRYLGCDGDRDTHDHPWKWCLGIPLIGGYTEERMIGFCPSDGWISKMVKIRPWRWNLVGPMRWHRIASVKPGTWTLFITWNRFKGWGFAEKIQGGILISQPYNVKAAKGWKDRAPCGHEFRVSRGTN